MFARIERQTVCNSFLFSNFRIMYKTSHSVDPCIEIGSRTQKRLTEPSKRSLFNVLINEIYSTECVPNSVIILCFAAFQRNLFYCFNFGVNLCGIMNPFDSEKEFQPGSRQQTTTKLGISN